MSEQARCGAETVWNWCTDLNCLINWLDHWQTLIAGAGAIAAALWTIWYLRKQIALSENQETSRRVRRLASARLRLQLGLDDTTEYTREVLAFLKAHLDKPHGSTSGLPKLQRPVLPAAAIQSFSEIVEATDDDLFAEFVSDLILQMQVLDSNLRALAADPAGERPNVISYTVRTAKVRAYADAIFPYARPGGRDPPHSLEWDRVRSALFLNNLYEDNYPDLHEFVKRARLRAENDVSS